jgi:anti-sigma-K factor RskA
VQRLSQSLNTAREETLLARAESVRATEINNVVTAPGALVAVINGTDQAPGASARLVMDKRTGRAVLAADGLPPAPAGKTYQLWYITGGKPLPGGLFTTDPEGRALLSDRVPEAGRDASLFAVTLEPAGGVPAPTGGMYLRGAAS